MTQQLCYKAHVFATPMRGVPPESMNQVFPGLSLDQVQQKVDEVIADVKADAREAGFGDILIAAVIEVNGLRAAHWMPEVGWTNEAN
jgi:hypothetical protein